MSPLCLPSSFGSIWLTVWEEMWFEEFQDGGQLGYWNRMVLAILNFHNNPMPPIKCKLNQTYHSGADVIWSFSRWLPWWPSWKSEQNHFSNSKSPCCPSAFHQVSAPSNTIWEQITIAAIMDLILTEMSKMWKVTDGHTDEGQIMVNSPWHKLIWSKAQVELTIENLQDGCCCGNHGHPNKMILVILNLNVTPMPPTKFWLKLTYHSGADEI